MEPNNKFSFEYFKQFIRKAQSVGYRCMTVHEFVQAGCPSEKTFVIRHDLDMKPSSILAQVEAEKELGVRSSIYVRVTANDYNLFSYTSIAPLLAAEKEGFEFGLHTNFVEYAVINHLDPWEVLKFESQAVSAFFKNVGFACHRDLNYIYNSLPWTVKNWDRIRTELGYEYHAYEDRIMKNVVYVNEGYHPHLCWRGTTPEQAIATGKSVCLLTHPHWWWKNHPFESGW